MTWAEVFWNWRKENQRTIRLPCPACGSTIGAIADFDREKNKVKRTCKKCGCSVLQDPVAKEYFK